ncbi:MAG: LysR family transcriptional regulator, partial [Erysipelotrichaceae bacterium]|nr:LysR family transcriptional regulator [Erysipelotrichaceae bacterium]
MIDLRQLEQLIVIAEEGTISKAAEKLNISQPALSR